MCIFEPKTNYSFQTKIGISLAPKPQKRVDRKCLLKGDKARIALAMDPECSRKNLIKVCFTRSLVSDVACNKVIKRCKKKNTNLVKIYNSCFTTFTCFGGSIF